MAEHSEPGASFHAETPSGDLGRLVRSAADGDQAAWNTLVERFTGLLWSICRSYRLTTADAQDVFQMTWLRLLENLGGIRDPERLPAWLTTTCRRECLSYLRRSKRFQLTGDDRLLDLFSGQPASGADVPTIVSARNATLWRAFGQLSERCQQILRVLVITAEEGPPKYDLAAEALSLPTGSLGPMRRRCLERLRKLLDIEGINGFTADS